jgi:type IV pilus assembly protein PilW
VSGVGGKQVCRDRTDGPDELVFVGRNPYYRVDFQGTNGCALASGCPTGLAWSVSAATAGGTPSITLQLRAGQLLEYGRSLLVTCSGGGRYTMATVGANVTAGANGNTVVPLYATSVTNPYFENNFADPCFTGGNALAFAMDRYRYFIRTFGNVPWLMLDTGLDLNGDNQDPWLVEDAKDLLPIAPYVEDLQVAYVLNRLSGGTAPDTNQNWVVGDDRSLIGTSEEPDPAATAPTYPVPYNDPTRANLHPANIRELRIALSLRSERRDQSQPASWLGDQLPVLENETLVLTAAQLGRYHRQRLISTLSVRNLQSHGMFAF